MIHGFTILTWNFTFIFYYWKVSFDNELYKFNKVFIKIGYNILSSEWVVASEIRFTELVFHTQ